MDKIKESDEDSLLPIYREKLSTKFAEDPEAIRFGPVYHVETSKGEPLTVSTIFIQNEAFKERLYGEIGRENVTRLYYLIAQDKDGNIVGVKTVQITFKSTVGTMISSFKKGAGVSTAIETAYLDLIQRYANEIQQPVTWEVVNYNATRLDEIRASCRGEIDELKVAELRRLEEQQVRWQSNWGNNEKLGLKDGRRFFSPNGLNPDLESIQTIDLQRVVQENEEISAVPTREETLPGNKSLIRQNHIINLPAILSGMEA